MSTSVRFTKILTAVAMTASLAACNDLSPSSKKTPTQTPVPAPVATTETLKPIEAPAPAEMPPPIAKETVKQPVAVENDDDGPHPPDTLATARKLLDDKQYDKALKLAGIAVKKMPNRSGAWNTLGRVQLQMGKRKDAIESFGKAVELNAKNSYAHNNLGLALIYDKRYEEAVDALEQAVELEPVEAFMWNNLGMAYEQLDRLDDARVAYGNAVEMDSGLARESLARLEGVKSVMRTAKVDTETKDGTSAPTVIRE
ncbi:MAG TPA: tetratricopeptide repeat protein [Polyangia bacterium]|jgi:predicted Zn-dependent protease|nr:tetratricopeptide repeat protein [Polyangia bacterium]